MKTNLIFSSPDVYVKVGDETRLIGEIKFTTLIAKRDPQKHIMKKWNAYGFSAELLESGKIKTILVIEPDGAQLLITVIDAKSFGRIHQEDEWDRQYFIPIDKFTKV